MPRNSHNQEHLPRKLRDDAILEALCQVRFGSPELSEVVIGKLSDIGGSEYVTTRLPFADIPLAIRQANPNFRHQPTLERRSKDGVKLIRIGEDVLAVHVVGTNMYPGWPSFRDYLSSIFEAFFKKLEKPEVKGVALRYINAIVKERHMIADVHDLNLKVSIGDNSLKAPMNLNFVDDTKSDQIVTTRIAHSNFVQGEVPKGASAFIDIEVSTKSTTRIPNIETLMSWIEDAHRYEKEAFFALIPREQLKKLVEK